MAILKIFSPIIRLYRYSKNKCIVCGKSSKSLYQRNWYCSYECMFYDGNNCKLNWFGKLLKLLFGYTDDYKKHFKYENRKEEIIVDSSSFDNNTGDIKLIIDLNKQQYEKYKNKEI